MARNTGLNQANKQKKDEFYTQLSDIENELRHYKSHFNALQGQDGALQLR